MKRISHIRKKHIKHKIKAKGRHSIHSPFLFDLYESCINNTPKISKRKRLFNKLKLLKKGKHITKSNIEIKKNNFINCFSDKVNANFTIINGVNTKEDIISQFNNAINNTNNLFVIIDNNHLHKEATQAWEEILNNPITSLSVDFHYIGLISVCKDFTRQHFILKL